MNGSDLPVKHWLYIAALFPIGATLAVAGRGGVMVGVWLVTKALQRADSDVMRWVETTGSD